MPRRDKGGRARNYLNVHQYPALESRMEQMRSFYVDPVSLRREGDAISLVTWNKVSLHILCESPPYGERVWLQ